MKIEGPVLFSFMEGTVAVRGWHPRTATVLLHIVELKRPSLVLVYSCLRHDFVGIRPEDNLLVDC